MASCRPTVIKSDVSRGNGGRKLVVGDARAVLVAGHVVDAVSDS